MNVDYEIIFENLTSELRLANEWMKKEGNILIKICVESHNVFLFSILSIINFLTYVLIFNSLLYVLFYIIYAVSLNHFISSTVLIVFIQYAYFLFGYDSYLGCL